jgi:hypothetical protein
MAGIPIEGAERELGEGRGLSRLWIKCPPPDEAADTPKNLDFFWVAQLEKGQG